MDTSMSQRVQQSKIPSSPPHLKTKTDLVSKTFLINLDDAQSPKHHPSSYEYNRNLDLEQFNVMSYDLWLGVEQSLMSRTKCWLALLSRDKTRHNLQPL